MRRSIGWPLDATAPGVVAYSATACLDVAHLHARSAVLQL